MSQFFPTNGGNRKDRYSKKGISIGYQNYLDVSWDDVAKGASDEGLVWSHEGESVEAVWEFGAAVDGEGLICLTSRTVDDPNNPLIVYYFHEK